MTDYPDDVSLDDPNFIDFDRSSKDVFASPLDDQSEWISHTPSINPPRPRTLAAGYDPSERTMSIIFRDGTWWSYQNVDRYVWEAFKQAESPGRFLRTFDVDGYTLDTWPNMGRANLTDLTPQLRSFIKKQALGGTWQRYRSTYKSQ